MQAPDPRMEELRDLVPFLSHSNSQVRKGSLDILLGFTEKEDDINFLHSLNLLRPTIRLVKDEEPAVIQSALQLLVNFSTFSIMLEDMIKGGIVTTIMEYLMTHSKEPKFALMILNNVSLAFNGAVEIFQEGRPYEGLHVIRLVKWFNDRSLIQSGKNDEWARIGSLLCNLTQLESFRRLIVDPSKGLLPSLKIHLIGESSERKLCVLRILHNLANDQDKHYYILNPDDGIWELAMSAIVSYNDEGAIDEEDMSFITPVLQSYFKSASKKYDSNEEVRKIILDILFIFVRNLPARKYLRAVNTYQILRELHHYEREVEHDAADQLLTEDLIPYFILDEADKKEDKDKPRSAEVAVEMLRRQARGDSFDDLLFDEDEDTEAADTDAAAMVAAEAAFVEGTSLPGFAIAENDETADIASAGNYNQKMQDLHKIEEARLEAVTAGKTLPDSYATADILEFL